MDNIKTTAELFIAHSLDFDELDFEEKEKDRLSARIGFLKNQLIESLKSADIDGYTVNCLGSSWAIFLDQGKIKAFKVIPL